MGRVRSCKPLRSSELLQKVVAFATSQALAGLGNAFSAILPWIAAWDAPFVRATRSGFSSSFVRSSREILPQVTRNWRAAPARRYRPCGSTGGSSKGGHPLLVGGCDLCWPTTGDRVVEVSPGFRDPTLRSSFRPFHRLRVGTASAWMQNRSRSGRRIVMHARSPRAWFPRSWRSKEAPVGWKGCSSGLMPG